MTSSSGRQQRLRSAPPQRRRRKSWAAIVALAILGAACSGVEVDATDLASDSPSTVATSEQPATTEPTTMAPPTTAPSTTAAPTTAAPTSPPTTVAVDLLPLPVDAAGVAAELSAAELALRDPAVDDLTSAPIGRRQQQMYRLISANPDWAPEVLAAVDPEILPAVELNWAARQDLSALVRSGTLSSTLPAWRINEPAPAAELISFYKEAEEQTGIRWTYLAAINLVETRMGRIEGLSTAGAVGPMQFLPSTWTGCCEGDPTVDRDAIIGAGVYLTLVGGPDDMQSALFGYNRSQRYVDAVSAYAAVLEENELAYRGYHSWEVYFLSSAGLIRMPSGYEEPEAVDAAAWLAENPEALVGEP